MIPSIHLLSPEHGCGSMVLELDEGRPRVILRRKNGRDGLYISCQGDGEVSTFHNEQGRPVLRLGFDPQRSEVVVCEALLGLSFSCQPPTP